MSVNDRVYEIEIQANETIDMELKFSPTEVASYDFELPVFINRTMSALSNLDDIQNRFTQSQLNSVTPYQSEMGGGGGAASSAAPTALSRDKTPFTQKTSRSSTAFVQKTLKRKVTAVGLRHALHLSSSLISFKIPIKYFENLKDGGFYEAKVRVFSISRFAIRRLSLFKRFKI